MTVVSICHTTFYRNLIKLSSIDLKFHQKILQGIFSHFVPGDEVEIFQDVAIGQIRANVAVRDEKILNMTFIQIMNRIRVKILVRTL